MGNHRARSSAVVAIGFAAAAICCCALTLAAPTARAQQGSAPGPPPPGNRDPMGEMRERQQREAQLRSGEMTAALRRTNRRGGEAAAAQMKGDFKSIQILRNKLARRLLSDKPLDYKLVAAESEEINERAGRLKSYLVPEPAGGEKKEPEPAVEIADAQMRDALATMCKRIDSFTENPLFKVPEVIDLQQSAKATRDLRHIILLSEGIKKTADRLNKTRGK